MDSPPFTPSLLFQAKPVVSIDLKDNFKELHSFIHLSKKCDEFHTPFSSKTEILKSSYLDCVGVNFIKQGSTEIPQ